MKRGRGLGVGGRDIETEEVAKCGSKSRRCRDVRGGAVHVVWEVADVEQEYFDIFLAVAGRVGLRGISQINEWTLVLRGWLCFNAHSVFIPLHSYFGNLIP
ncbi:hypothetical protein Tco_1273448 [Tanacetum coccineum]